MKKLIGYRIKQSSTGKWYRARRNGVTVLEEDAFVYTRLQIVEDIQLMLCLRRRKIILKPVYAEV